jgi:hypothetical protein
VSQESKNSFWQSSDRVRTKEPRTVEFTGNELGCMKRPMKEIAHQAMEIARKKFGGKSYEATDGKKILVTWQGIKHGLSADANPTKVIVVTKLDEVINNSVYVRTDADYKKRDDIKAIHLYKANTNIGGEMVEIGIVARELDDGSRYYDHFETKGDTGTADD